MWHRTQRVQLSGTIYTANKTDHTSVQLRPLTSKNFVDAQICLKFCTTCDHLRCILRRVELNKEEERIVGKGFASAIS